MSKPSASDRSAPSGERIQKHFEPEEIADILALVTGVRPDLSSLTGTELGDWLASTLARPGALDVVRSLPLEGKLATLLERVDGMLADPEEDTAPRLLDKEEDTAPRLRDREDITQPEVDLLPERTDPHAGVLSVSAVAPDEREITDVGVLVHDLSPVVEPAAQGTPDPGVLAAVTPPPLARPSPLAPPPPRSRMPVYLGLLVVELLLCGWACAGLLFGGADEPVMPAAAPPPPAPVEHDLIATIQAGAPSAEGSERPRPAPVQDPALGDLSPAPAVEPPQGALLARPRGQPTGQIHAALPDLLDMRFIELTAGEFTMGAGLQGGAAPLHERPAHRVRVDAVWVAASEVSVAQWYGLHNKPVPDSMDPRDAMGGISWCDAVRYANLLSEREGLIPFYADTEQCEVQGTVSLTALGGGYRLPTEPEWEYAARAGRLELPNAALPCLNARHSAAATGNGWGFLGMNAVVWEWTWDAKYRYSSQPRIDTIGPSPGVEKVIRGGSWASADLECSVTSRTAAELQVRSEDLGFRLARSH